MYLFWVLATKDILDLATTEMDVRIAVLHFVFFILFFVYLYK